MKGKLTEKDISQLLDESKMNTKDGYKETESGTLDTNDDGESDYISKKSAYESSNDNILDELLQTQEPMMNTIFLNTERKLGTLIQLAIQQEGLHYAVFCNKCLYQPILVRECLTVLIRLLLCLCIKINFIWFLSRQILTSNL